MTTTKDKDEDDEDEVKVVDAVMEDEEEEEQEETDFLSVRNFQFVHDFGLIMLLNQKVTSGQIARILKRQRSSIASRISALTKAIGVPDTRTLQAKDVPKLRKLVAPQSTPSIRYGELTDKQISDAASMFLKYLEDHESTAHISESIAKSVPKGIVKVLEDDTHASARKRKSTANDQDSGAGVGVSSSEVEDSKRRRLHNPSKSSVQEVDEPTPVEDAPQTNLQAQLPGETQPDPTVFDFLGSQSHQVASSEPVVTGLAVSETVHHVHHVVDTRPSTPEHGSTPPRTDRERASFGSAPTNNGEVSASSAALSSTGGLDDNTTHSGNVFTTQEGVYSYCRTENATQSIKEQFLSKFNLKGAPTLNKKDTEWELEEGQYVVGAFNMMTKQNCTHYMLNTKVRVFNGSFHVLVVRDDRELLHIVQGEYEWARETRSMQMAEAEQPDVSLYVGKILTPMCNDDPNRCEIIFMNSSSLKTPDQVSRKCRATFKIETIKMYCEIIDEKHYIPVWSALWIVNLNGSYAHSNKADWLSSARMRRKALRHAARTAKHCVTEDVDKFYNFVWNKHDMFRMFHTVDPDVSETQELDEEDEEDGEDEDEGEQGEEDEEGEEGEERDGRAPSFFAKRKQKKENSSSEFDREAYELRMAAKLMIHV